MMRIVSRHFTNNKADDPALWLLFSKIRQQGVEVEQYRPLNCILRRYDIFHIHWPEHHLKRPSWWQALAYFSIELVLLDIARARGARLVWTAHNARSHEGRLPKLEHWAWRRMMKRVAGYFYYAEEGRRIVLDAHPELREVPGFLLRGGSYREVYPNRLSRAEARARLELPAEARVLLFLGSVRAYKNVPQLCEAFMALPDDDLRLVIAGRARAEDAALAEQIRALATQDARILLKLEFIEDEALQVYFNACDLVVAPFRDILNSGSVLLALSFDRPVLLAERGAMREMQAVAGDNWLRLHAGDINADELAAGLDWLATRERPARFDFAWGDWDRLAGQAIDAYRQIANGSR